MNFDYRGSIVSTSVPTTELRTVKKVFHVDSADRDTGIFYTNGDFVVYLPRVYEKVVSLRLMSAEFPTLESALTHSYSSGINAPTATYTGDTQLVITGNTMPNYFLVDIEGLNKGDETSVGSQRSQHSDSFFAKIANTTYSKAVLTSSTLALGRTTNFIEYNDHSGQENKAYFNPPIGKLDRLQIKIRTHAQQGDSGFIYWASNFSLSLELEYIENNFDIFSSFETRVADRAAAT